MLVKDKNYTNMGTRKLTFKDGNAITILVDPIGIVLHRWVNGNLDF